MSPAFLAAQDVHLSLGLLVGLHGAGLDYYLTPFHLVPVHAAQQDAHGVAGLGGSSSCEHFQAGGHGAGGRRRSG